MSHVEPYYYQKPVFAVVGLTLKLDTWQFRCRAIDPADPLAIRVDLPTTEVTFIQDTLFSKSATLYVTPVNDGVDNYYLDEVLGDGLHTSNPPVEKWTPDISVVPCLNITIKAGATMLEVTANEFDLPDPPDLRREIQTKIGQIKAWRETQQPEGWEPLDAKKHKKAFPISLGQLKRGENWYVLTPEAEEKLKKEKIRSPKS